MTVDISPSSAPAGDFKNCVRVMVEKGKAVLLTDYKISGKLLAILVGVLVYVWNDNRARDIAFQKEVLEAIRDQKETLENHDKRLIVLEHQNPSANIPTSELERVMAKLLNKEKPKNDTRIQSP